MKEPVKWTVSRTGGFLADHPHLSSRIYLAHVREGTVGGPPNYADTHPFSREIDGRDYVFAHNGTLSGSAWDLPLGRFQPIGGTDSERFFCHLLDDLARQFSAEPLATESSWKWLHNKLSLVNKFGKLNILLSDGNRLFVYHDVNGWKGLSFSPLSLQDNLPRHFGDADIAVEIEHGPESRASYGYLVATYPLLPTGWEPFHLGELLVFDRGRIVHSSHRRLNATDPTEPDRLKLVQDRL